MRPSNVLALSVASGFLAGAALLGLSAGIGGMPAGSLAGLVLGMAAGGYLLACESRPLAVVAVLLAAMPVCLVGGWLLGVPALQDLPPLLTLPLVASLARRPGALRFLRPTPLTVAAAAYGVCLLPGVLLGPPEQLMANFCAMLAPLSLFVAGMLLPAVAATPDGAPSNVHAAVMPRLGSVAVVSGVGLAALTALALAFGLHGGAAVWANPLALLLVLALAWDTPRTLWRTLLGGAHWAGRAGLALAALAALLLVAGTLVWRAPDGIVLALGVAALAVFMRRRRLTELLLLAAVILVPALFAAHPSASSGAGALALIPATFGDTSAWSGAVAGFSAGAAGVSRQTQYLAMLSTSAIPGLAALVFLLGAIVYECRSGWRRLRPTGSASGAVLAASGMALYVLIASLTSAPLFEPTVGMIFWLFVGVANTALGALATAPDEDMRLLAEEELRGHPLRVAYVAGGAEAGETPAALADLVQALDRRRVAPLLIAYGSGPLPSALRGMRVAVREVRRHDGSASYSAGWVADRSPRLRQLAITRFGSGCLTLYDALRHRWETLHEWLRLTRAVLDLRPDLLVSTAPHLHIPALVAGRIAGVPVQWHARDAAPPGLQRSLNVLALWTDGVLVPSQALARGYSRRLPRSRVRVLRPSVALPPPAEPARIAALRAELGIEDASPVLAVVGPVTFDSGHDDLLDAAMLLLGRYPRLRLLFVDEALPGQGTAPAAEAEALSLSGVVLPGEGYAPALLPLPRRLRGMADEAQPAAIWRLRQALAGRGLSGVVSYLGPRLDAADVLAASDMAVFPFRRGGMSRGLLLALAQGVPIVATNVPAVRELVAEAWACELVAPDDPEELVGGIERTLAQLDLRRASAHRNPGLVRDWYGAPVEAGRAHILYRDICMPAPWRVPLPVRRRTAGIPQRWHATLWAQCD